MRESRLQPAPSDFFDEPVFMLDPEAGRSTCYGSCLQLESLGLIPADIRWPSGRQTAHWMAGRWQWTLSSIHRTRGECKEFKDLPMARSADCWCLSWYQVRQSWDCPDERRLKERDRAKVAFLSSKEGQARAAAEHRRWWAAQQDQQFAQFMRGVVALSSDRERQAGSFQLQGGRHE